MAGLLGFTLADLSGAVDSRKRQYANLVRGLLSDPGATLAQLAAVDAEAARGNRYTQMSAGSVMPEVAQQGQEAMLNAAMNVGGLLGITAYHGSPHTFDKFDMSKIGTGEGAQAYGHGLYFAENPGVAKSYQTALASQNTERTLADLGVPAEHVANASSALRQFTTAAEKGGLPWERAAKNAQNSSIGLRSVPTDVLAQKMKRFAEQRKGAMYQVDIPDEAVSKMLDWDKPLSQQPEAVRKQLAKLDPESYSPKGGDYDANELGQQTYQRLIRTYGTSKVSAMLNGMGIPGIRYLDAGSRGKGGTSNFVLFDDNLPKILSRE